MPNTTIGVRVTEEDRKILDKVCKLRGEDLSDFVRRAILKELAELGFLSEEKKKALGLQSMKSEGK